MKIWLSGVTKSSIIFALTFLTSFFVLEYNGVSQPAKSYNDTSPSQNDGLTFYSPDEFLMGADLSYLNQVLDHGGTYHGSGSVEIPYKISKEHGTNVVQLRLWHNPDWVQEEVYYNQQVSLYSGLQDVARSIEQSKQQGMAVNLDFHYSNIWADPGEQRVPVAWTNIRSLNVLHDSVYEYTRSTLQYLDARGLFPDMVQIGNETNCGMVYSEAPAWISSQMKYLWGTGSAWENITFFIMMGIFIKASNI